jgi:hypothetical protein
MNRDILYTCLGPLLSVEDIRALRCINRDWQHVCDSTLLCIKGVFTNVSGYSTVAAVKYCFRTQRGQREVEGSPNPGVYLGFLVLCRQGTLNDIRWAIDVEYLVPRHRDKKTWFLYLLENGNVNTAAALFECYNLQALCNLNSTVSIASDALNAATSGGSVKAFEWVMSTFSLGLADILASSGWENINAFQRACRSGHLALVQYLVERYDIQPSAIAVRCDENEAMSNAIQNRRYAVVQYLHEVLVKQEYKPAVISRHRPQAYTEARGICLMACEDGNLDFLQWATAKDLAPSNGNIQYMLAKSVECGHQHIAEWIVETHYM